MSVVQVPIDLDALPKNPFDMLTNQPLVDAAQDLLAFVRAKYPDDFRPGGRGYICQHHRAIATALGRDDMPPAIPRHVCGLQGFGQIDDRCPGCDYDNRSPRDDRGGW